MEKNNKNKKAVVLLSGGMDSAVCLAIALEMGFDVACLHLNYGHRTQIREEKQFHDLCKFYDVKNKLIIDTKFLSEIGNSSLTDSNIDITDADLESNEIPSSYVPFRNANIITMATSWAEVIGAKAIFIGAVQEDSSGYPDTRKEFFDKFEELIDLGTKPETKIKIYTPIIDLQKNEIIETGLQLGVPFELTWSCYKENEIACGVCDSCALRLRAFERLNKKDPLEYEIRPKYLKK